MSQISTATPQKPITEAISNLWWLMLLRGLLLVIVGAYALTRPGITLLAFAQVLGLFVLIDGFLAVIAGIAGWTESRGWAIARGVLGILIGLFVLGHPLVVAAVTATIVMLVLAFQLLVGGIMEIIAAIRDRKQIEGEGWLILSGVLSIIFGVVVLLAPFLSGLNMIRILGAFAIVFGVALVINSFRVRRLGKALS